MIRRPPRSTRTATLFPYTTRFRSCEAVAPAPTPTATSPSLPGRTPATVVDVVDGDTIVVEIDGVEQRVRYIGIDTPETVHPSRPVQELDRKSTRLNSSH